MGSLVISSHDAPLPWSTTLHDSRTYRSTPDSHLHSPPHPPPSAHQTPSPSPVRNDTTVEVASPTDSRHALAPPQPNAEPPSPRLPPADDVPAQQAPTGPGPGPSPAPNSTSSTSSPATRPSATSSPTRIKVRDLKHIQSFVNDETSPASYLAASRQPQDGTPATAPQYEISDMPVTDIIEMVAGLLTKITTTNDRQHEHLHRQIPPLDGGSALSAQTSSVLAFHGKNVPSITIMSYLSRIHKYCPTTYDVFLSLLVFFDRMTERVNAAPMQNLQRQATQQSLDRMAAAKDARSADTNMGEAAQSSSDTPPASYVATPVYETHPSELPSPPLSDSDPYSLSNFFVVDSFNIHRLVIAGVTCASKFFSDIFYTNSRYAKVGGLPLVELNHLELQFLLLNDFRLSITAEELEAYGTMLVEFYAREVVAQRHSEDVMEGVEASAS